MEKNKNSVCNINIFNKYWNLLLLNYNKTHTQNLFNLYYSIFKIYSEQEIKEAFKEAMLHERFFPNINELNNYFENPKLKKWDNIKKEEASNEEIEELKKLLEK